MTDEELKDEILALFEEKEGELLKQKEDMEKLEDEAFMEFEKEAIAIKNRLVQDVTIPEDQLEAKYLEEVEKARVRILEETKEKVDEHLKKIEASAS